MSRMRTPASSMGEINVVPYIDVMLVLLIIFMVTAPLLTQGIKVELPKAGAEPLPEEMMRKHQPLILSVDRRPLLPQYRRDEESPIEENAVVERVATVLRREPETPVLVKADKACRTDDVVTGMVLLQEAGAEKVGFITDPADTRDKKKKR